MEGLFIKHVKRMGSAWNIKEKVHALLTILMPIFLFLPKSHKTLLRTSRKVNVLDENDDDDD